MRRCIVPLCVALSLAAAATAGCAAVRPERAYIVSSEPSYYSPVIRLAIAVDTTADSIVVAIDSGTIRAQGMTPVPSVAMRNLTLEAIVARKPVQSEAGEEEQTGEDSRRSRQQVGRAAARHEARTTAHAEAAALGFLQHHRANQHGHDHEVNDDDDSLHCTLPTQVFRPRSGRHGDLQGF